MEPCISPRLPVVEMWVRTCIEKASRSSEPSGHSTYGMSPCFMDYRSRCVEQFAETHASGLDPG
eukprot:15365912-Ditylum_brightwellii.AAC.1